MIPKPIIASWRSVGKQMIQRKYTAFEKGECAK